MTHGAVAVGDRFFEKLSQVAKDYGVHFLTGVTERADFGEEGNFCSSAFLFLPDGSFKRHGQKQPIVGQQATDLQNVAEREQVWETPFGRLGVLISSEAKKDIKIIKRYQDQQVETVCIVANDGADDLIEAGKHIARMLVANVIVCAPGMDLKNYPEEYRKQHGEARLHSTGAALVISADGGLLSPVVTEEGFKTFEIDRKLALSFYVGRHPRKHSGQIQELREEAKLEVRRTQPPLTKGRSSTANRPALPLKVVPLDLAPSVLDRDSTLRQVQKIAKEVAAGRKAAGTDVLLVGSEVMFPGFLRGWAAARLGSRTESGKEFYPSLLNGSVAVGDDFFQDLSNVAKENGIYFLTGVSERGLAKEDGNLYCSAFLFLPDGSFKRHRKIPVTSAEKEIWSPGNSLESVEVWDTPLGKLGVLICWEALQTDLLEIYRDEQVEAVFVIAPDAAGNWIGDGKHTAAMLEANVIMSSPEMRPENYPDAYRKQYKDDLISSVGLALVVGPDGKALTPAGRGQGYRTFELDRGLRRSLQNNSGSSERNALKKRSRNAGS